MNSIFIHIAYLAIIGILLIFYRRKNQKIQITPDVDYWEITDDKDVKTSDIVKQIKENGCDVLSWSEITNELFPTPTETKKYKCKATIESDAEHKGKSYEDFIVETQQYMNGRQYLILYLHCIKQGIKIDVKGWTRTISLWPDGDVVCGRSYTDRSEVCLSYGSRDGRSAFGAPRTLYHL